MEITSSLKMSENSKLKAYLTNNILTIQFEESIKEYNLKNPVLTLHCEGEKVYVLITSKEEGDLELLNNEYYGLLKDTQTNVSISLPVLNNSSNEKVKIYLTKNTSYLQYNEEMVQGYKIKDPVLIIKRNKDRIYISLLHEEGVITK
jgi:hypothetical protein